MLFDKTFDLYRKEQVGKLWDYKEAPMFETVQCKVEPVNLDVETGIDNQPALQSYRMYTRLMDVQVEDKIIVDGESYIVNGFKDYKGIKSNYLVCVMKKEYV